MSEKAATIDIDTKLTGGRCTYVVQDFIGEGSFGKVARCKNMERKELVAVKLMGSDFRELAEKEHRILEGMRHVSNDHIVRYIETFEHESNICMVFENLGEDLHTFMVKRDFHPLPLRDIREVAQQLFCALKVLRLEGVVHCDIKPDNIMFISLKVRPYRMKLIDFGLAMKKSDLEPTTKRQALGFRAPEVILGAQKDCAVDMWSVGPVLCILFTGKYIYPVTSEYDQLRVMVQLHGTPPYDDYSTSEFVDTYFYRILKTPRCFFLLKEAALFKNIKRRPERQGLTLPSSIKKLEELPTLNPAFTDPDRFEEIQLFMSLLKSILEYSPKARIDPVQAIEHPFISQPFPDYDSSGGAPAAHTSARGPGHPHDPHRARIVANSSDDPTPAAPHPRPRSPPLEGATSGPAAAAAAGTTAAAAAQDRLQVAAQKLSLHQPGPAAAAAVEGAVVPDRRPRQIDSSDLEADVSNSYMRKECASVPPQGSSDNEAGGGTRGLQKNRNNNYRSPETPAGTQEATEMPTDLSSSGGEEDLAMDEPDQSLVGEIK